MTNPTRSFALLAAAATLALSCRSAQTPPPSGTDVGVPSRIPDLGPASYAGDRRSAVFPAAWPHNAGRRAVFAPHGMVASDAPLAGQAGIEIMRRLSMLCYFTGYLKGVRQAQTAAGSIPADSSVA